MTLYKIFLKRSKTGVIEDLELIKDGFNFFILIFQVLYLLYKKLWKKALILFLVFVFLNSLQYKELFSNYITISIQLSILLYVAFECNDWIAKKMIKDGYEFLGFSSGNNIKEAKLKFLENMNENYTSGDKLEKKIF